MFQLRLMIVNVAVAVLFLAVGPDSSESARILGFFPTPTKSHLIVHAAIADALAEQGHNVTVFTTIPLPRRYPKLNHVLANLQPYGKDFIADRITKYNSMYRHFGKLVNTVMSHVNNTFVHPTTQALLRDHKDSFDLLLLGYYMNDFHLGLGAHFNCPVVVTFMLPSVFNLNQMVGNPSEVAYVPTLYSQLKQHMDFKDRLKNFLIAMFEQHIIGSIVTYKSRQIYDVHFPSDHYPSLNEMYRNISLVLTNSHFSQGPIRPNVPAVVEIGGIQIKEKPDPLPSDLAAVLDTAEEGVIYFSLGSYIEGSQISAANVAIMLNVLSQLPYKVLWKWGEATPPGTSDNIVFKSWLPQDDILAHRNVKLFITHGGLGSVVEAQYHGVPMVGMPLFSDQPGNIDGVVNSGFGVKLIYSELSEQNFREAIEEVMGNPQYKEAVQRFSTLYRDRPLTARQTAVFWVEYVLRHRGAPHLQSPAIHLHSWQLQSLDVIAFIMLILGGSIAAFVAFCRLLCCRGRKPVAKKDSARHSGKVSKRVQKGSKVF